MLISGFLFAGVTLIALILFFATSIILIGSLIALICFINKHKKIIREKGIEESNIKKIKIMSIFSIITSIFSCLGCVLSFLPMISIIMCGKAKKMLSMGIFEQANKKAKIALILLMITNIITLVLVVLNMYSWGDLALFPLTMIISSVLS